MSTPYEVRVIYVFGEAINFTEDLLTEYDVLPLLRTGLNLHLFESVGSDQNYDHGKGHHNSQIVRQAKLRRAQNDISKRIHAVGYWI